MRPEAKQMYEQNVAEFDAELKQGMGSGVAGGKESWATTFSLRTLARGQIYMNYLLVEILYNLHTENDSKYYDRMVEDLEDALEDSGNERAQLEEMKEAGYIIENLVGRKRIGLQFPPEKQEYFQIGGLACHSIPDAYRRFRAIEDGYDYSICSADLVREIFPGEEQITHPSTETQQ